jgi:tetratricopeptide (TPR) repeat protein
MLKQLAWGIVLSVSLLLGAARAADAESPRIHFNRMVKQLQQNPSDEALREQIIQLASKLKPPPAMPDEAERRMARGTEAFKEAKSISDYQAAVNEFQQATLAAPWLVDAYFNLGLAQDKAEDYERSLRSLKLAILASPNSKDIKDLYYKVEYQRDKFAEQNSPAAKEAARQTAAAARQAAIYQGLDGGVWQLAQDETTVLADGSNWRRGDGVGRSYVVVNGHEISAYSLMLLSPGRLMDQAAIERPVNYNDTTADRYDFFKVTFTSRDVEIYKHDDRDTKCNVTISDDGQTIVNKISWHYPGDAKMFITNDIYRRIK